MIKIEIDVRKALMNAIKSLIKLISHVIHNKILEKF
jgi:hypothetical protein